MSRDVAAGKRPSPAAHGKGGRWGPPPAPILELRPIGVVRTPFAEKVEAPRQTFLAGETRGRLELFEGRHFEDALSDLEGWEYLWVLYWFDRNEGWRPKVLPPRSEKKRRGVFATRSPHRPNPIGLSVVKLERVEERVVHVRGVDMLDGTPLLDIKPYLASADAFPDARAGWTDASLRGEQAYEVAWTERAERESAWLRANGFDLVSPVERALSLGPQPHAYRRIRPDGDAMQLAVKEWRVRFHTEGRRVTVLSIASGYRPSQLADAEADPLHVAFARAHWAGLPDPLTYL